MSKKWTQEQIDAIRSRAPRLKIRAFAGTGKTSTALGYTLARPNTRFLYLVYNKSARIEAQKRFPSRNVCVKTSHSLAFNGAGRAYKHKTVYSDIRIGDVRRAVDPGAAMSYGAIADVIATLKKYLQSPDQAIELKHAYKAVSPARSKHADRFVELACKLWAAMCDTREKSVPMIPDGYLKLFALQNPDLSRAFDQIIVDEAQDLNPVTRQIVESQKIPVVMIGDEHQSLYRFRGAVNALGSFKAHETLNLTTSFRFGPETATLANSLLTHYKDEQQCLLGFGPPTQIKHASACPAPHTRIHRTFAETFSSAFAGVTKNQCVAWVGGVDAYPLTDVVDVYWLSRSRKDRIVDKRLSYDFDGYAEYKELAQESEDPEMLRLIKIVDEYGADVPQLVQRMKDEAVPEPQADFVVTTAHRSKGLEWDRVVLADDFPDLHDNERSIEEIQDEANLLYVAVTRAQNQLMMSFPAKQMMMSPPPPRKAVS